jgi:acetolactate synthase-1/3 small subunit
MQLSEVFGARVVDVGPELMILEFAGPADKIDGLIEVLQPYGVVEMVRTGAIAMTRGAEDPEARTARPNEDVAA